MKKFLMIVLASTGLFASANGNRVGNGGDVVECPAKVELLDFYESSLALQSFDSKLNHKEIAADVLKNLKRVSPRQADQYSRRLAQFFSEVDLKSGVELKNIRDSKHLFSPKDESCKVAQIAIRRNEASSLSKRFTINKDLWRKLSEQGKAGLVLHEIIYEHFYKLGEDNSVKARSFNAYLFSEQIQKDNAKTFWKLVRELKVPLYQ